MNILFLDKKYMLCLFFLLFFSSVRAQDFIVTTSGDTITCRIVSISDDLIMYEQSSPDGYFVGYRLPIEQVSIYYQSKTHKEQKPFPAHRLQTVIQGGAGYRLKSEISVHWGCCYGADIHYMFNHWGGIGIKYSGFNMSYREFAIIDSYDGWSYWCINAENRIYLNFIGLSFNTLYFSTRSDRLRLTSGLALGYTHYRREMENDFQTVQIDFLNQLLKCNSFGGNVDLGVAYFPWYWMSIGVNASCFLSWFRKGTMTTDGRKTTTIRFKEQQSENINASRIDLSIGVKFHF